MKKNKGITLVALVITVIVLLILALVTINAITGEDDLIAHAKNAATVTKQRIQEEQELVNITTDQLIAKYTTAQGGGQQEGGATLTWTHVDANRNNAFDVGEVVTASNGESLSESFYVIEAPANGIVKLLATKCVDTTSWLQNDTYNKVAFDSSTNVYENASIKELVETYVTETLCLNANQGRLMSKTEADVLQAGHTEELYGTTTKFFFWLGSPCDNTSDGDWVVYGGGEFLGYGLINVDSMFGIRPVVEISISSISEATIGA